VFALTRTAPMAQGPSHASLCRASYRADTVALFGKTTLDPRCRVVVKPIFGAVASVSETSKWIECVVERVVVSQTRGTS